MSAISTKKTIDCTPTWSGILAYYLEVFENGNPEGRKIAMKELSNMAKVADAYVTLTRPPKELSSKEVTEKATGAFWMIVQSCFPGSMPKDFPADLEDRHKNTCLDAVKGYVRYCVPVKKVN